MVRKVILVELMNEQFVSYSTTVYTVLNLFYMQCSSYTYTTVYIIIISGEITTYSLYINKKSFFNTTINQ